MTCADLHSAYDASKKSHDQTSAKPGDALISFLEKLATEETAQTFAILVETVHWSTRRPDKLNAVIDLALQQEMVTLATRLAQ